MHLTFIKWNSCHKLIWETSDLALLELCAFLSFWPPIGPKILQKAGNTHFKLLKCKFSRKLKVFVSNGGFLEKSSHFSIKTIFAFLENPQISNIGFKRKTRFLEKIETPQKKKWSTRNAILSFLGPLACGKNWSIWNLVQHQANSIYDTFFGEIQPFDYPICNHFGHFLPLGPDFERNYLSHDFIYAINNASHIQKIFW